jgi:hypothetical protein
MEEEGEGKKVVQKADLSKHQVQVVSSLMSLNQETEAIEVRTPAVPRFTPRPAPAARVPNPASLGARTRLAGGCHDNDKQAALMETTVNVWNGASVAIPQEGFRRCTDHTKGPLVWVRHLITRLCWRTMPSHRPRIIIHSLPAQVCALAVELHKNTKDMATYVKKEYEQR